MPKINVIKGESNFDTQHTFEQRKEEVDRILNKYPDRIPVLVFKAKGSKMTNIDKQKYLVPSDLTIGQLMYVIRKRIKLTNEQALFLFINGVIPPSSALMNAVYEQYKSEDGFLRVMYCEENTFG